MSADVLTLAELQANDPTARGPRYLCPLPSCAAKDRTGAHRSLSVGKDGLWHCFRCGAGGQLREFWPPPKRRLSRAQRSIAAARRAFG